MKRIKLLSLLILALPLIFSCEKEEVEIADSKKNISVATAKLDGAPQTFPVTYSFTLSTGHTRTVSHNVLYRLRTPSNSTGNSPLIITMGGGSFVALGYNGIQPNGTIFNRTKPRQ